MKANKEKVVYVVMITTDYGGDEIQAIFDTESKAYAFMNTIPDSTHKFVCVEEFEIQ